MRGNKIPDFLHHHVNDGLIKWRSFHTERLNLYHWYVEAPDPTQYSPPASLGRPGMRAGSEDPVKTCKTEKIQTSIWLASIDALGGGLFSDVFLPMNFFSLSWCFFFLPGGILQDWNYNHPRPALSCLPPAAVWTSLRVANHLTHLYEDTVHAGRLGLADKTLLLQQTVGHGHTVANTGVVVIAVVPPPAHILHSTTHGRQHQQRDKTWQTVQIYSLVVGMKGKIISLQNLHWNL